MADSPITAPWPATALASSSSSLAVAAGSTLVWHTDRATETFPSASASSSSSSAVSLVRHIAISPDNAYVATVSDDKTLSVYSTSERRLLSTRTIIKKCSDLAFAHDNSILVADKVGDVHLYPLEPRQVTGDRPLPLALQSDPTLNPDADYLLGHVSVLTASIVTPDGQHVITADRDEHIRVSRFPKSYIVERYLFGTEGFVSALHVPAGQPSILLSGGGEQWIRIWDWTTGEMLQKVDIDTSVLPHRRVRSSMRRVRIRRGKRKVGNSHAAAVAEMQVAVGTGSSALAETGEPREVAEGALAAEGSFYSSPEGWTLPSGKGVLIKRIRTMELAGQTMVIFMSEGAAAIFAFPLDASAINPPPIHTLPLDYPVLDFTPLPSPVENQILLSLDTTWGILKQNPRPGQDVSTITPPAGSITAEAQAKMNSPLVVAEISPNDGWTLARDHAVPAAISLPTAIGSALAKLQLYPLLSLLPRWPGMEEDDDLAGPSSDPSAAHPTMTQDAPNAGPAASAPSESGGGAEDVKRNYTHEELEQMGNKMLGRLKSQGVDVEGYFKPKQRKPKNARGKKRRVDQDTVEDGRQGGIEDEGDFDAVEG